MEAIITGNSIQQYLTPICDSFFFEFKISVPQVDIIILFFNNVYHLILELEGAIFEFWCVVSWTNKYECVYVILRKKYFSLNIE